MSSSTSRMRSRALLAGSLVLRRGPFPDAVGVDDRQRQVNVVAQLRTVALRCERSFVLLDQHLADRQPQAHPAMCRVTAPPCSNASKIRGKDGASMPIPLSITRTMTRPLR